MKKTLIILFGMIAYFISIFNVSYASTFKDLEGTKYEEAVEKLYELKIVNGMPDGTFDAFSGVTRGQMAKMLILSLDNSERDLSSFKSFDDTTGHWSESYAKLANYYGFVRGYEDGSFKPDKNVTYAEAIAMTTRVLYNGKIFNNPDGAWYENYLKKAVDIGLLGNITNVNANDNLNRGDTAILINNLLEVIKVNLSNEEIININSWEDVYYNNDATMMLKLIDGKDGTVTLSVSEYDEIWDSFELAKNKFQIIKSSTNELYIGISLYDVIIDSYDSDNSPIYSVNWEDEIIKLSKLKNDIRIEIIQGKQGTLKLDTLNTYEIKSDETFIYSKEYKQKITKQILGMKGKYTRKELTIQSLLKDLIGATSICPIKVEFENKSEYNLGFYFSNENTSQNLNENYGYISGYYFVTGDAEDIIELDFETDEQGIISKIIFK